MEKLQKKATPQWNFYNKDYERMGTMAEIPAPLEGHYPFAGLYQRPTGKRVCSTNMVCVLLEYFVHRRVLKETRISICLWLDG